MQELADLRQQGSSAMHRDTNRTRQGGGLTAILQSADCTTLNCQLSRR